jgi:N-acetylglucosamine-6-sulfatase
MTSHVPPGWGDWHGAGYGYWEFNYELNEDGVIDRFGGPPPPASNAANYLTDVLNARAREFVALAASVHRPFVIEVATFAPHKPSIPAPRNANDFPGLSAPRGPSFDTNNTDPPAWLGHRAPLTRQHLELIDKGFRMRAQSVEAVDKLIADLEATLRAHGLAKDTYIVFSSDNGYHMGEHRLLSGKQTAFDSDIRVPLIVVGPGVARGRRVGALVQNIDLYPTFTELAGARPTGPVDGRSLVPLLNARRGERLWWRSLALIEHRGGTRPPDPDFEYGTLGGNPTSYEAIRLARAVYVEYVDGEREYYEIGADPFERHNVYARLPAAAKAHLHALVGQLSTCRGAGATSCWNAAQPRLVSP